MKLAFIGYLSILAVEYFGLGNHLPALKHLHYSLIVSAMVFVYLFIKGGNRGVQDFFEKGQTRLFLVFMSLTLFSVFYGLVRLYGFNNLKAQIGYFMLFASGYFLVREQKRLEALGLFLLSIHLCLVLINFKNFFSETRTESFNAGYFLGDGNDFGWGLNIVLPFAVYAIVKNTSILKKGFFFLCSAVISVGIFGTLSRGATLAFSISILYLILKSKNRALGVAASVFIAAGVFFFAPPKYFERMETIVQYSSDSSAMGRIGAWKAAINMASENPLGVGAGSFNSAYGRFYRPAEAISNRWISAHSIYFVVLGEYGFPGLILIVSIIIINIRQNGRSASILKGDQSLGMNYYWPVCLNMSIIAYSVGGFFLGGINYPHIYILSALTLGTSHVINARTALKGAAQPAVEPGRTGIKPFKDRQRRAPSYRHA
ncbi:MAG: O-antigen ligase family protein [Thermodesulfobacteriota bacterium]|nr:MAG: O-antigen ligase family protein [Thermodesulfobacteriota bacterium]